ncbi:MAG TPA: DUF2970 domain-containing protein [Cycloclasticus sp.]|jgi:Co/Zn/Cd efflux system component|nr:DUF2970 domain-containing protein [Cycloclasticus sp.]HIL92981.1 DUF2970 domain-containing protein [Cycloclasticus sp.]
MKKDDELAPSFWQMVGSTMLSFLGVSKQSRRERDFKYGNPKVFIVTGFIMAFLFIMIVVGIVQLVLPS